MNFTPRKAWPTLRGHQTWFLSLFLEETQWGVFTGWICNVGVFTEWICNEVSKAHCNNAKNQVVIRGQSGGMRAASYCCNTATTILATEPNPVHPRFNGARHPSKMLFFKTAIWRLRIDCVAASYLFKWTFPFLQFSSTGRHLPLSAVFGYWEALLQGWISFLQQRNSTRATLSMGFSCLFGYLAKAVVRAFSYPLLSTGQVL